jgi:hypothetical protein
MAVMPGQLSEAAVGLFAFLFASVEWKVPLLREVHLLPSTRSDIELQSRRVA